MSFAEIDLLRDLLGQPIDDEAEIYRLYRERLTSSDGLVVGNVLIVNRTKLFTILKRYCVFYTDMMLSGIFSSALNRNNVTQKLRGSLSLIPLALQDDEIEIVLKVKDKIVFTAVGTILDLVQQQVFVTEDGVGELSIRILNSSLDPIEEMQTASYLEFLAQEIKHNILYKNNIPTTNTVKKRLELFDISTDTLEFKEIKAYYLNVFPDKITSQSLLNVHLNVMILEQVVSCFYKSISNTQLVRLDKKSSSYLSQIDQIKQQLRKGHKL